MSFNMLVSFSYYIPKYQIEMEINEKRLGRTATCWKIFVNYINHLAD